MSAATTGNGYFADWCWLLGARQERETKENSPPISSIPFRLPLFLSSQSLTHTLSHTHTYTHMHMSDSEDELPLSQRAAINNNLSGKMASPFFLRDNPFSHPSHFQVSHFPMPHLLFQSKRKNLAITWLQPKLAMKTRTTTCRWLSVSMVDQSSVLAL